MLLTALLALTTLVSAQTPPFGKDTGIKSTFNAPAGATAGSFAPYCSATLNTFCVVNYSEFFTPPAGVSGGAIPVTITSSSDVGGLVTFTWKPSGGLYCGTWGTSVIANWKDGSGNAAVSPVTTAAPTQEPCPFTASPVTGLVSTPTP